MAIFVVVSWGCPAKAVADGLVDVASSRLSVAVAVVVVAVRNHRKIVGITWWLADSSFVAWDGVPVC